MRRSVLATLLVALFWLPAPSQAAPAAPPPADRPAAATPARPAEAPPDATKPPPDNPPPDATKPPPDDPPPRDGGHLPGAGDPNAPGAKPWPKVMYGLGLSGMFNIVPNFFLKAFTEAAKSKSYGVYQPAFGLHFVRRKANMDMTVRVMFGFYDIADGNWLGRGHGFDETDYTEFHNMNFLWADITWTWHTRLAKRFYLAYGAGIGIGWVTGSVYTTPSDGCTADNFGDARLCHPSGLICTKDGCERADLKTHPQREKESSMPPVLPALNALIGLRYDFFRHLSMRFDTGIFLPGFWYVQLGLTAMF